MHSPYISTSTSESIAKSFLQPPSYVDVRFSMKPKTYLYRLFADPDNSFDVNASLKQFSEYPDQLEIAIYRHIPASNIIDVKVFNILTYQQIGYFKNPNLIPYIDEEIPEWS